MIRVLDGIALYAIYGIVGLIPLAILPVAGFTLWETPKVAVLNIFSLLVPNRETVRLNGSYLRSSDPDMIMIAPTFATKH